MSRHAVKLAAPVAAIMVGACSGSSVDFELHDTGIIVETDALFARRPEFPARLEDVLSVALQYWGGDWRHLAGRTITFSTGPYLSCGGSDRATGCFDGDLRISTSDPGVGPVSCVEQTVLVHEVGHAVLGDRMHSDPRWMDFETVGESLAGRLGYTSEGEVECVVSMAVWRHPLDRP